MHVHVSMLVGVRAAICTSSVRHCQCSSIVGSMWHTIDTQARNLMVPGHLWQLHLHNLPGCVTLHHCITLTGVGPCLLLLCELLDGPGRARLCGGASLRPQVRDTGQDMIDDEVVVVGIIVGMRCHNSYEALIIAPLCVNPPVARKRWLGFFLWT